MWNEYSTVYSVALTLRLKHPTSQVQLTFKLVFLTCTFSFENVTRQLATVLKTLFRTHPRTH